VLGYSEPPLFIETPRLLLGNSYLWRVRVVIYERPTTDRIRRIRQVVKASTPRWTFKAGMKEVAREALAILRHEADERLVHSQYHHFPSQAEEGAEAVVLPARDHDRIGCFIDQVKLTHTLIRDLDEAIKEVKLLGEHEEESSQDIMELETLCKKLREDAQKLKKEKATLEGMVKSHDELIMEIIREIGLDRMGEDAEDGDKDEDGNDGGDATAPPAAAPEEIIEEGHVEMVPEQEAPVAHEVILADAEPEMPQPRIYHALVRDYEESPLRMMDDLDDLDDPNEGHSDMDEWFPEDGSIDRD
jgi:hypothetical protein